MFIGLNVNCWDTSIISVALMRIKPLYILNYVQELTWLAM